MNSFIFEISSVRRIVKSWHRNERHVRRMEDFPERASNFDLLLSTIDLL